LFFFFLSWWFGFWFVIIRYRLFVCICVFFLKIPKES